MTDEDLQGQVARLEHALAREREASAEWKTNSRKWEARAKTAQEAIDQAVTKRLARVNEKLREAQADRDAFDRAARLWEHRAKTNLTTARAHESTIAKFIAKLDDVLNED